jgi:cytochrome P450 family 4
MFDITKKNNFIYRFTDMYKRSQKCMKILNEFTDSVIAAKRKELSKKSKISDDTEDEMNNFGMRKKTALLDLLLQSTIDGEPLSDRDIREEVDMFMFAVNFNWNFKKKSLNKF